MSERITINNLSAVVERLNKRMGFTGKVWNRVGNENRATVGMLVIDAAYGGYAIAQIVNESGGERQIIGRGTARETYNALFALEKGLDLVRTTKGAKDTYHENPRRKRRAYARSGVSSKTRRRLRRIMRTDFGKQATDTRRIKMANRLLARHPARTLPPLKKNPAGIRIVYNKLLGGWYVVRGPHQTPLNGRFGSKAEAEQWLRERQMSRNPSQKIRSTARRAGPVARKRFALAQGVRRFGRGKRIVDESRYPQGNYYKLQVRRRNGWLTLAGFPKGELGHARAREYGRIYAARFPGKQFRVFWPD